MTTATTTAETATAEYVNASGSVAPSPKSSSSPHCPFCGNDKVIWTTYECGYSAAGGRIQTTCMNRSNSIPLQLWDESTLRSMSISESTTEDLTEYSDATDDFIELTHDEISTAAHDIWNELGQPTGQDLVIWTLAEEQVKTKKSPGGRC